MRKAILLPIFFFCALLITKMSYAQTTLALGDIAFTGYSADPATDEFSFVILRTGGIAAGTVIKFTDRGWWGVAPNTTCGSQGWATNVETEVVWTAAVAIPYGRQIRITGTTAFYQYGAAGTVTGTALALSATGDQIFAYQGIQTGAYTMLAGIHMNIEGVQTTATNWDNITAVTPGATQSNRPACIVNGTHGLFINPEVDNARLRSSVILTGNPATDRSRVNDAANWEVDDATPFTLPGALSGLPVDFTWIKALEKGGSVSVEWGIGTEEDVVDYTIEKSDDGRLYMEVGTVPASRKGVYNWTDVKPVNGNNFYRIKATEVSGVTKYSTVAVVNLSKTGKGGINVYPTVVRTNQFNLQITNMPAGSYKLHLVNSSGQMVFTRTINHTGGSATQSINMPSALPKGLYRINMFTGKDNVVTNIIVE